MLGVDRAVAQATPLGNAALVAADVHADGRLGCRGWPIAGSWVDPSGFVARSVSNDPAILARDVPMTTPIAWLRVRWERGSRLIRLGYVLVVVVAIGLVANLLLRPTPISYAGTFVKTGSMTTPRDGATATLLADGRVLVAGGRSDQQGTPVLASAELYDPTTGSFAATGPMGTARADAAATLLPDGRVLVAGGVGEASGAFVALSSAELYDPKTGAFTDARTMTTARVGCTMTALGNGRVLVAGGANDLEDSELASAEVYDPAAGTFTTTGQMHTGREAAAAALLPDGRVLVAGGAVSINASTGALTASAELYDPATGTFATAGPMASALEWRSATLLIDGYVLVAGGRGVSGDLVNGSAAAELFDPATNTFAAIAPMHGARARPSAVGLPDGRVLIVDGSEPAELFDPDHGTFSLAGAMVQPRIGASAVLLVGGQVLVAGGSTGLAAVASAELFQ